MHLFCSGERMQKKPRALSPTLISIDVKGPCRDSGCVSWVYCVQADVRQWTM